MSGEWIEPAERQAWRCAVCGEPMADRRECASVCCLFLPCNPESAKDCDAEVCERHRALAAQVPRNPRGGTTPDPHASTLRITGTAHAAHNSCVLSGPSRAGLFPLGSEVT